MKQKSMVAIALLILIALLSSTFLTLSEAAVSATFGNTQVGQYTIRLVPGYKDSCRYQASQTGTINSISMYIQTANAQVRFGIYSDVNGKPSQLLVQSNQVTTSSNSWVTAGLTASVVAGQYYWVAVISNAAIVYNFDYAAGASAGYGTDSTTTMSASFGTFMSTLAAKFSMYASYSSTSTVTPSPTSTPTPTPNSQLTVTPQATIQSTTSARNLAIIPNDFPDVGHFNYAVLDYSVTHNGHPSIRLDADYSGRGTREVNGYWRNLKPGDRVYFGVWVKTDSYSNTIFTGGRIGIDLYGNAGGGKVIQLHALPNDYTVVNGVWVSAGEGSFAQTPISQFKVPWGKDWTYIHWDFVVPNTWFSYDAFGNYLPTPSQITGFIPWFDARELYESRVWFSDAVLYINP